MMFFQDTRSIGLVFWIVVALLLFDSGITFLCFFTDDMSSVPLYVSDPRLYCLLMAVGSLVTAAVYGLNAHRVMSKTLTRLKVISSYVTTVGICTLINGIVEGLALFMYTEDLPFGMMVTAATIVIGLIVIMTGLVLADGKKGLLKKIICAVLVISFVLMAADSLTEAANYSQYAVHIAHLLISVFMLMFITDREVRIEMGAVS